MKHFFLILSVLVLSSNLVNAQKLHIGIKAGANMNKLTGESFKEEFAFNYHAGAYVKIKLGEKLSLQPELLFSQLTADTTKKFSDIYQSLVNTKVAEARLNYLNIPVLLNYKLSKLLEVQAGPQFSIVMNQSENIKQNSGDAFKKGDLGVIGGLQVNLGTFKLYGRYIVGLTNINDIDNKDEWKTQTIQLGLALQIF